MSDLRRCPEHGAFEGDTCPACDRTGSAVLNADRRRRLSKFMSGALRHFPDDVGIAIDDQGWTDRSDLVEAVEAKYDWACTDAVEAVVATDPKGRFEVDADRIRAAYGHSVDVNLAPTESPVPDVLFHGTSPEAAGAIREEGIQPMSRQLVHLSGTVEDARAVGARHAPDPTILRVDAAAMLADDHRITKRGQSVYTTEFVPQAYVARCDDT